MPEFTGWLTTDAQRLVECPRCHQKPGQDCRTPKGRVTNTTHGERTRELLRVYPEAKARATVRGMTGAEFMEQVRGEVKAGKKIQIIGLFGD